MIMQYSRNQLMNLKLSEFSLTELINIYNLITINQERYKACLVSTSYGDDEEQYKESWHDAALEELMKEINSHRVINLPEVKSKPFLPKKGDWIYLVCLTEAGQEESDMNNLGFGEELQGYVCFVVEREINPYLEIKWTTGIEPRNYPTEYIAWDKTHKKWLLIL